MAVSFVSGIGHSITSGATADYALPAGLQEGDLVLVAIAADSNGGMGVVAGQGYGRHVDGGASTAPCHFVDYKFMGSTPDSVVSIVGAWAPGAVIQAFRGVDQTTPFDAAATWATGNSSSPNPPSNTSVTDGAMRVAVAFIDDDPITSSTPPAGFGDQDIGQGSGSTNATASTVVASQAAPTAGASDPSAFSLSHSDEWFAYHLILRPAGAGGTDADATPGTGAVTVAGHAPTPSASAAATPGPGAVTVTGHAPEASVSAGASASATPGTGTVAVAGHAPAASASASATPGPGAVAVAGHAPSVGLSVTAAPGTGAVAVAGHAPTADIIHFAAPGPGAVTVAGHAPEVSATVLAFPGAGTVAARGHAPSAVVTYAAASAAGIVGASKAPGGLASASGAASGLSPASARAVSGARAIIKAG